MSDRLALKVARIDRETDDVLSIRLEAQAGQSLPAFTPGAHIDLHLPNGTTPQYSLANDPAEADHYLLGVLRERESRGGSAWIHAELASGMLLEIGLPRNNFPLVPAARTLFIAGGIGVTPMLSMAAELQAKGAEFAFHYCTRSPEATAFRALIAQSAWSRRVTYVHDGGDPSRGLDVKALLAAPSEGTHLYCCGPAGLMNAVRDAAGHWPTDRVHFEWFSPDAAASSGDGEDRPFTCVLKRSGLELTIPADKSIVEVLRENNVEIETLCEDGLCGTCITDVSEGEIDHRDSILTPEEQAANDVMTVCCSRAKGDRLVLDL